MSTALDLDISELVGEMPAEPCESASHDPEHPHHDADPATHYAQVHCPDCGFNAVKTYCRTFVESFATDWDIECSECHTQGPAHTYITVLGPIGGTV
jgi:hypothetical protein